MADKDKRFYWIKLKTDFFKEDSPIDFLMSQPNGCQYVVLYQMLCLKTANNGGLLATEIGEIIIPFDVNKIVRDTKYFDFDTVTVALQLFKKLGLIYESEENGNILKISSLDDMVGSEAANAHAQRQKRYRDRQKQKAISVTNSDALSDKNSDEKNVTKNDEEYRDKSIENRDKENREKRVEKEGVNSQQVVDMFNDTCVSFPHVRTLTDKRKKALTTRLKKYSLADFQKVFSMAEASGFLKGQNSRGWQANFDWLINESNMVKVLEGNYNSDMQQNRAPNSKWAKSVNDSSRDKQYSELEQRILNFGASDD